MGYHNFGNNLLNWKSHGSIFMSILPQISSYSQPYSEKQIKIPGTRHYEFKYKYELIRGLVKQNFTPCGLQYFHLINSISPRYIIETRTKKRKKTEKQQHYDRVWFLAYVTKNQLFLGSLPSVSPPQHMRSKIGNSYRQKNL